MTNKTIFCVSAANCDLFKNNFCNLFTNRLPHFQEKGLNYEMSLGSIHIEKMFRTIGHDEKFHCFLLIVYDIDH